jgi:hypothetical protein
MKLFRKILYASLIILTIFLAFTTVLGGIALLTGWIPMDEKMLAGSIFPDYTLPGLALALIAGGSATLASILLLRKSRFAILFSIAAGIVIMFFEFVEVLTIGAPAGLTRTLQAFYFGLGTFIAAASIGVWFIDLMSNP